MSRTGERWIPDGGGFVARLRPVLPAIVAGEAICKACGHTAAEHAAELPSPCMHGAAHIDDGSTVAEVMAAVNTGCRCIGFVVPDPTGGQATAMLGGGA